MDIRCKKTSCKFNESFSCKAKIVKIGNTTTCQSYVKGNEVNNFTSKMFEVAPEFANSRHILDVNLNCAKTSCLFNSNKKCEANGITVLDEKNKPCCITFIKEE